ncbi:HipA domain-containing protein [Novosphingobium sp. PS1R-30]|uniref:HipA domain-containing protein n=1 Tax=Novosphingobium anseongense TaxID=3133436 RepID=A0ABU8S1S4_9SPHN
MTIRLSLDVRLDGVRDPVGRLDAHDTGSVSFTYAQGYAAGGRPISMSLPLGAEPIGDGLARAFFDNLLPENDQMQRVIDREGLDRADIVDILAHVGGDCPGAISCVPVGAPAIKVPGDLAADYRPLEKDEIALIAQRLADREPLPAEFDDPSPVAGVQRKIAITVLEDGRFAFPIDGRKVPTTHILKVPRRGEAGEALQEDAACRIAHACGFAVSRSHHTVIEGVDALLIERFDRLVHEGTVYRVHQEDFAQALGLPARLKYERNGAEGRRYDTQQARSVLDRLAAPAKARETFVLATLFNLAIGNTDNHAKNHGVLYSPDGSIHLAPLYDLLPIRLHGRFTHQLAVHLGGATDFDDMTTDHMLAFLAEFGLQGPRARRFINGPVREMLETIEARSGMLRTIGLRLFDDLIGREIDHLAQILEIDLDIRERDYFEPAGGGWLAS